ncbi:MAG: polymer-forming cytoskeletal protein [Pseudomonadota bacterium]
MLKNFMQPAHAKTTHHSMNNSLMDTPTRPLDSTSKSLETPTSGKSVSNEEGNKLTVGPNIKLKGSEITDCEILVVEGRVEASMNSRDIRIAEGGVFSGTAEIDVAEIRGHFEGELTARKRLVIYATGKVTGQIRYGALKIEEGGVLSGDIATLSTPHASLVKTPEMPIEDKAEALPESAPGSTQAYPASVLAKNSVGRR